MTPTWSAGSTLRLPRSRRTHTERLAVHRGPARGRLHGAVPRTARGGRALPAVGRTHFPHAQAHCKMGAGRDQQTPRTRDSRQSRRLWLGRGSVAPGKTLGPGSQPRQLPLHNPHITAGDWSRPGLGNCILSRLLCPQSGPRRNPRSRDFPRQETAVRLRSRNSRRNSGLDYPGGPNLIAGMFKNGAGALPGCGRRGLWSEGDVTGEGQSAGTAGSGGGGGAASGSGGGRSTSLPSGLRRERNCEIVALRGLSHRSHGEV